LHHNIRSTLQDAQEFIGKIASDAIGFVFLEAGRPVQPDLNRLATYQRHAGASGGVWPSSPEIDAAMFEHYQVKPSNPEASHPKPSST
jgi:hypothetical protein